MQVFYRDPKTRLGYAFSLCFSHELSTSLKTLVSDLLLKSFSSHWIKSQHAKTKSKSSWYDDVDDDCDNDYNKDDDNNSRTTEERGSWLWYDTIMMMTIMMIMW